MRHRPLRSGQVRTEMRCLYPFRADLRRPAPVVTRAYLQAARRTCAPGVRRIPPIARRHGYRHALAYLAELREQWSGEPVPFR